MSKGKIILAGGVFQNHARIGKHVIVNISATIDHNCQNEDFAHIEPGPNICDGVMVGERSVIRVGSVCTTNVSIRAGVVTGGKSYVLRDTPDKTNTWGAAAKEFKTRSAA